jgi:hypothetical protein
LQNHWLLPVRVLTWNCAADAAAQKVLAANINKSPSLICAALPGAAIAAPAEDIIVVLARTIVAILLFFSIEKYLFRCRFCS